MEAANAITTSNNVEAADTVLRKELKGKKKQGQQSANVLKVALLTLFGRRKTAKCIHAEAVAVPNNWAMIVGCMRPLNLQEKQSTLMLPDSLDDEESKKSVREEKNMAIVNDDMTTELPSSDVAPLSSSSCSECSGESRYASALNLQELDKEEGSSEEEEFDDTRGDAMIDMKAEMFIAEFYVQMRIQNMSCSSSS